MTLRKVLPWRNHSKTQPDLGADTGKKWFFKIFWSGAWKTEGLKLQPRRVWLTRSRCGSSSHIILDVLIGSLKIAELQPPPLSRFPLFHPWLCIVFKSQALWGWPGDQESMGPPLPSPRSLLWNTTKIIKTCVCLGMLPAPHSQTYSLPSLITRCLRDVLRWCYSIKSISGRLTLPAELPHFLARW